MWFWELFDLKTNTKRCAGHTNINMSLQSSHSLCHLDVTVTVSDSMISQLGNWWVSITWFSDKGQGKAEEWFEFSISVLSLDLRGELRSSRHQGIPNRLQERGVVSLLTKIEEHWVKQLSEIYYMIKSLGQSPWCNGDGGALQPTEARALPMWVFQRERGVPIIQVLSSVFVPLCQVFENSICHWQVSFLQ